MKNNNFNNEKIGDNNIDQKKNLNGIRNIDIPERDYLQENRFKEINFNRKKAGFWKKFIIIIIFLSIVVGVASYFFHSANFKVKNNTKDITFTDDIMKANIVETKVGEEIPFDLLKFNVSLDKDVKSEMVEDVAEKAVGKIKIINNSSKVQKLKKETRFEVDGKIFKTYKTVSIPAKSSIIRDAFADVAGEEYNLEKGLKMVVPGFKEANDMNLYKQITGEIAESFKGGFIGKKDIPDKKDLEEKKKILAEELESTILIKVRTKLPKDFILNTDGIFKDIKYEIKSVDGQLKVIGTASVKAIIFNKKEFLSVASGLIKSKVEKYDINSTAFLKFKILDKDKISIDSLKSFTFELNGELKYNRKFNKTEFINLVRGKTKSEFDVLKDKNYEDFTIETQIFPFWMNSIPMDSSKISVEIVE